MKLLAVFTTLTLSLSLIAQENSSLQASFNKALKEQSEPKTELVTFQANVDLVKNAVQLKWMSNSTTNAGNYVIERSVDKLSWTEVATVYGAPHKKQATEYFHIDYNPLANLSYYRIRLVNNADEIVLSNVVPVNFMKNEGPTAGMNLDPSYAMDNKVVNIAFEEVFEKEILMVVRDQKGEEYYSVVEINIENEELVAVPIEREIPSGDYLIIASSENQLYSQNIAIR